MNSKFVFISILSWINFQFFYNTIVKFLIHTPAYAFMVGWDREMQNNLLMSSLYLVISSLIFSLCISIIFIGIMKIVLEIKSIRTVDKPVQSHPFI